METASGNYCITVLPISGGSLGMGIRGRCARSHPRESPSVPDGYYTGERVSTLCAVIFGYTISILSGFG